MATSMIQKLFHQGTKIVGVSRNYAAHAKEPGNAVPNEPGLFLKPTSPYLENGGAIEIPHPLESLRHEVEVAVVIGKKARDVPESVAMDYIGGTPEGCGPVNIGQTVTAGITGLTDVHFDVARRQKPLSP